MNLVGELYARVTRQWKRLSPLFERVGESAGVASGIASRHTSFDRRNQLSAKRFAPIMEQVFREQSTTRTRAASPLNTV